MSVVRLATVGMTVVACASPAPMHTARLAPAVTGRDGRIYLIGGLDSSNFPIASVEAYDVETNTWTDASPLPQPTSLLGAALGKDGRIYAVGGSTASGEATAQVEAFDPKGDSWAPVDPLPRPRTSLSVASGGDGRIYAIGGEVPADGGTLASTNEVDAYDPSTHVWAAAPPCPGTTGPAAGAPDGRIYVLGASPYVFDPATNAWAPLPALPSGISGAYGVTAGVDGRIYAIGGETKGLPCNVPDEPCAAMTGPVEIFDPVARTWSAGPGMPRPADAPGLATGLDGRIYAAGGSASVEFEGQYEDKAVPYLQVFIPSSSSWWD